MATSLRQRRRRDEEDASSSAEDPDYDLFVQQYKITVNNNGWGIPTMRHVALFVSAIISILTLQRIFDDRSSSSVPPRNIDLKILTVYPRSVSSIVHQLEGKTELLVTNDNREAVSAIRTSIGMANNLRYNGKKFRRKRRKGGVVGMLLGISNFIASLRSNDGQDNSLVPGEVVLESYDDVKIRRYLVDHGEQCSQQHQQNSNNPIENSVLMRYDELTASMTRIEDDKQLDALWNYATQLFTWCQLVSNRDARGYLAHGTPIRMMVGNSESDTTTNLQEMLEEARLKDIGIAVQQTTNDNDASQSVDKKITYGPLFVLPGGSASKDVARKILYSILEEDAPPSLMHANPLLFLFDEGWLQEWPAVESKRYDGYDNNSSLLYRIINYREQ